AAIIGRQVGKRREVGDVRGTRRCLTFAAAPESDGLQVAVLCEGLHDGVEVAPSFGIAVCSEQLLHLRRIHRASFRTAHRLPDPLLPRSAHNAESADPSNISSDTLRS